MIVSCCARRCAAPCATEYHSTNRASVTLQTLAVMHVKMVSRAAIRQRRYLQRQRCGLAIVPVTVDEIRLIEALRDIGLVSCDEPSRNELAVALSKIIGELLTRHEKARWGSVE